MLIEYEKGIKKNKQQTIGASSSSTPQVMAIQGGMVQKKPHGKAKGKAKGGQYSYPFKTKKPQPQKKEHLPPGAKVVKSKWIYKKKTDMDGVVYIYKARLVAKGFTQTYGDSAYILEIKIYRDRSRRLIGLSQDAYLDKILKRYRMGDSKR
nr:zinc finger, CCHC-type [Tanacetum cinerariifolium]